MSIVKHKEQRVGVFIDTQNLYHSAKNLFHSRVNFDNVLKDIVKDRQLIRARAYVITTTTKDESNFFEALTKIGIETKTKDLQIFHQGVKKADWDVGIAVDAISVAEKLDTIILVTGDGDFVPLVEYLQKTHGCQVEVATFSQSCSQKLIETADDFFDLSENPKKYLIQYQGKNATGFYKNNFKRPNTKRHTSTPTNITNSENTAQSTSQFEYVDLDNKKNLTKNRHPNRRKGKL